MGESSSVPAMLRPFTNLVTMAPRIAARLWSPTYGSPLVQITRAGVGSPPRYDVRVYDPKPLGSVPITQPQWHPERVVFSGTRVEILAWANAGHYLTDAAPASRAA